MKTQTIPWTDVFDGASRLVREIQILRPHMNMPCYLMIGRGGLAVAALMARFQPMERLYYLPLAKYNKDPLPNMKMFTPELVRPLEAASTCFLLDDIYDSGRTLEFVAGGLTARGVVHDVVAATLYTRRGRRFRQGGHLYYRDVPGDEWLVFPWEAYDPVQEVPF